jgi:DNA-nicking Smr family endonuclease
MARTRFNFFIDEAQRDGLRAIKVARGVGESEQIRRAIDDWLKREGVTRADRERAGRKRTTTVRKG